MVDLHSCRLFEVGKCALASASTRIRHLPNHSQEVAVDVVSGPKILVVALDAALDAEEDIVRTAGQDEISNQERLDAASSVRSYLSSRKSVQRCRRDRDDAQCLARYRGAGEQLVERIKGSNDGDRLPIDVDGG